MYKMLFITPGPRSVTSIRNNAIQTHINLLSMSFEILIILCQASFDMLKGNNTASIVISAAKIVNLLYNQDILYEISLFAYKTNLYLTSEKKI